MIKWTAKEKRIREHAHKYIRDLFEKNETKNVSGDDKEEKTK